jgi:hypothetical protein
LHHEFPLLHAERVSSEEELMPVLLQIPENPNCAPMDAQVFQCRSATRTVVEVLCERGGRMEWCAVTGMEDTGALAPATACLVEDSGDGACYLVVGGEWGLRLKLASSNEAWDLANGDQWGEPYFLLSGDGSTLRFAE